MRFPPAILINSEFVDASPAVLARPKAKANANARALARARWLLRRKEDGRFLGHVSCRHGVSRWVPMQAACAFDLRAITTALQLLGYGTTRCPPTRCPFQLRLRPHRPLRDGGSKRQLHPLAKRLNALGIDAGRYGRDSGLMPWFEPKVLCGAGTDRYGRPVWLALPAARAWFAMRNAATLDAVRLEVVSAFRSHAYQHGIFQRKLARGQRIEDILRVNAAPGFSEHHSGLALDLGVPDVPPAEEGFEATSAFVWLQRRAAEFGFALSYPRDNPHGIVYEPWHWCWHPR